MEVKKVITKLSAVDAESLLSNSWKAVFSEPIRSDVLRLLLALWDLETASGLKMANHNWGNIKTFVKEPSPVLYYIDADDTPTDKFRSYPSASNGALEFILQLTRSSRPAWHAGLLTGDPEKFVVGLKDHGYFTAPIERYLKTFVERWNKYSHLAGGTGDLSIPKAVSEPLPSSPSVPDSSISQPRLNVKCDLPTLKMGAFSLAVKVLQRALNVWGYPAERLLVGGGFDKTVQDRVISFQVSRKLKADGVVGPITWKELLE